MLSSAYYVSRTHPSCGSTSAAKEGPLRKASLEWKEAGKTRSKTWLTVSSVSLRMPFVHDTKICSRSQSVSRFKFVYLKTFAQPASQIALVMLGDIEKKYPSDTACKFMDLARFKNQNQHLQPEHMPRLAPLNWPRCRHAHMYLSPAKRELQ